MRNQNNAAKFQKNFKTVQSFTKFKTVPNNSAKFETIQHIAVFNFLYSAKLVFHNFFIILLVSIFF